MSPTYGSIKNEVPWLHGSDLKDKDTGEPRDVKLTIKEVDEVTFTGADGKDQKQAKLFFEGTDKVLGVNTTNRICLRKMFGPMRETDEHELTQAQREELDATDVSPFWVGKRVTFHPVPERNPATKRVEPAVRIKGSPDLDAPVTFTLVLPRKKPKTLTLAVTGKKAPPPVDDIPFGEDA